MDTAASHRPVQGVAGLFRRLSLSRSQLDGHAPQEQPEIGPFFVIQPSMVGTEDKIKDGHALWGDRARLFVILQRIRQAQWPKRYLGFLGSLW